MIKKLSETSSIGSRTKEWLIDSRSCSAMNGCRMQLAGLSMAVKGFSWVRHCPASSQVLVCYQGQGEVLVKNSWQRCKAGTAILLPAKVPHAYRAVANARWGLAWAMYKDLSVPANSVNVLAADPWPLRHSIEGLYRQTRYAPDSPAAYQWLELVHGYVIQLFGFGRNQGLLTNVWTAVDAELARPWTLFDLAGVAHLSKEHLRRLSHDQHGRSPMQQVTYMRIQRAASLLSRTDDKIEVIARDVGLCSLSSFSAAFKHWMGVSPAAFRQRTNAGALRIRRGGRCW